MNYLYYGDNLEEDGELWDSTDTLVALSRQLVLARGRPQRTSSKPVP